MLEDLCRSRKGEALEVLGEIFAKGFVDRVEEARVLE